MAIPLEPLDPRLDTRKLYEEVLKEKEELVRRSMMGGIGSVYPTTPPFRQTPSAKAMNVLKARMDWEIIPFPVMHVAVGKTKTVIFIFMDDDKYVVIEDDSGMFPSDATVTKLRMLSP